MKIAIVVNDNFTVWRFRKGLIETLVKNGHKVHVITPKGDYTSRIVGLGAAHTAVPMDRFINPLNDLMTIWRLFRIFRRESFDIVHNMQIKPTLFGGIAAFMARVPKIVSLVPGLGYPFFVENKGLLLKALGALLLILLRFSCRINAKVWFQNPDDMDLFIKKGIIERSKAVLIRGSGVDVGEFSPDTVDSNALGALRKDLGLSGDHACVTMIVARLIWSKGVKEFIEAAAMLQGRLPAVRFVLIGSFEERHPDAIPREFIVGMKLDNLKIVTDFREDIREILAVSDTVVLPSYFKEGVPRVLIEALALGKSVITTTNPGCREVVDDGENGFLVPAKDPKALAEAIRRLAEDKSLRERFGRSSRQKALAEFDERDVVKRIMGDLYGLGAANC